MEKNGWGSIYPKSYWGEKPKKKSVNDRLKQIIKIITKKK